MVNFASTILRQGLDPVFHVTLLEHPVAWIHMPIPRDHDDHADFLPLHDLRISPETELLLWLVRDSDGTEGARRQITAASKVRPAFGIATECRMARANQGTCPQAVEHPRRSGTAIPELSYLW